MARGKNDGISKYTQVFERKGPKDGEPVEAEASEKPTGEMSKQLAEETKKREALEAELAVKEQKLAELQLRLSNMENANLEEELRQKVEELNNIKDAYAKKMKNTIALQRIKYEKEIEKIRKDMKRLSTARGDVDGELVEREKEIEVKEERLETKERELERTKAELEEMKGRVSSAKSSGAASSEELSQLQGDYKKKMESANKLEGMVKNREIEINDLKAALAEEVKKKENAQTELTNVKKGSVAMMKYITTLQSKKSEEELAELRNAFESELNNRMALEESIRKREEEISLKEAEITKKIADLSSGKAVDIATVKGLQSELEKKGAEIKAKEEALKNREKEIIQKFKSLEEEIKKKIKDGKIIQDVKREFQAKEEDLRRVKEILKEKEDELKRRETELQHRLSEMTGDKTMEKEVQRLNDLLAAKDKEIQNIKSSGGGVNVSDLNEEVSALQDLVLKKEDELAKKDESINALKGQINEMASNAGQAEVGVLEERIAEKEATITNLTEQLRQMETQVGQAKQGGTTTAGPSSAQIKGLFEEVKDLRAQLEVKEIDLRKLKDAVSYKDTEITRRELEMQHKEELMKKEWSKVEEAKKLGGSVEEAQLKKRLEALETAIQQKEEELKQREKFIAIKMEDIKRREGSLVEEDLAARSKEREMEFKEEKIKSGNPRLDDLLYGGIPFGKQILIMGPPFIGKETMVNNFLLEGVSKGIPCLILTTDSSPADIRDELKYIMPDIEQYEAKGLVKYIDAYSKAMGMDETDPNMVVVDHPTDYKGINKAIEEITAGFRKFSQYWRMCVRSVSALVTLSDPTTTYRFLQNLTGRSKKTKIVVLYLLDKGMHNEQEIQTLGHLMDGALEFKTDGVKTFLAVQGICDVQSRMWIQYQYSKRGLNIGSFTLDHIK
jgi:KaiC/GvpD/RAD55 family RecA-like ATPase/chromosome segregation ATPase